MFILAFLLVLLLFEQKAIIPAAIILVFDIAFVLALVAVFSISFFKFKLIYKLLRKIFIIFLQNIYKTSLILMIKELIRQLYQ